MIEDADYLAKAGRFARGYSLSYCAKEELSKLYFLLEVSWKKALDVAIDWHSFWAGINDHIGKAAQFIFAEVVQEPPDLPTFWTRLFSLRVASVIEKASLAFRQRNDGLYCDIDQSGAFRTPMQFFSQDTALASIDSAKDALSRARLQFGEKSAEDYERSIERAAARRLIGFCRSAELFNKYEDGSISTDEHKELCRSFGISESERKPEMVRLSRRHAGIMAAFLDPDVRDRPVGRRRTADPAIFKLALKKALKRADQILKDQPG